MYPPSFLCMNTFDILYCTPIHIICQHIILKNIIFFSILYIHLQKVGIKMLSLRINEILEQLGKTPYWLGKQTGISQNNIAKICNGETSTIRFETLEKICLALNCSINDLFTTDNPQLKRLLAYQTELNKLIKDKSDTP